VTRNTKSRPGGKARGAAISDLTAQRLSIYLRCLDDLQRAGTTTISSQALAAQLHLNSAQIRKDLSFFGGFGVRGVGYSVAELRDRLARIMGLTRDRKVVIVGAGNLGMALADYGGFNREGFSIVALFDSDPAKVGTVSRGGVRVLDMALLPEVARREKAQIALLAVPAPAAQRVLDLVTRSGVRAILNFAPAPLRVRPGIVLKSVDLKIQLENLVFHLTRAERG